MDIRYTNIFVSDLERAIGFYRDVLGLVLNHADPDHGYASFNAGTISLGLAVTDQRELVGRHTGLGFMVDDIDATYDALSAQQVHFEMPPTRQPWGGTLALFADPDGNIHYLDAGEVQS